MTTAARPRPRPVPLGLQHELHRTLPELALPWAAAAPPDPSLVLLNEELADGLGIDVAALRSESGIGLLTGTLLPDGARPVAMAYAGHQFGGWSPRLGDGRALLLGELTGPDGQLADLHLKGSGRTPFARGGDGLATLGSMLREHLMAEAMHALGIPTGRALAVVSSGQPVVREAGPLPGAVLTRVADSHLRVGTFEYAARLEDRSVLRRLADHAIARHHPEAAGAEDPALALLEAVVEAQASLVARWMLVGFIHGVMNTDNVAISGQTIDYGPCAFMDRHDPDTVYSSIDRAGRYAYRNQPPVMHWNLSRLAETLLPLMRVEPDLAVEQATGVLRSFEERYDAHWQRGMASKLGLEEVGAEDAALLSDLPVAMTEAGLDHTSSFRALADGLRGTGDRLDGALAGWRERWLARLAQDGRPAAVVADAMDAVNPVHIPRNHLVEEALADAVAGDMSTYEALLSHVTDPYRARAGNEAFTEPAPPSFEAGYQTFCGT
ncbi:YdiU family protein [soil metagenome]